jgi:DNA repair exonuclease SbcCD ATPase subunit
MTDQYPADLALFSADAAAQEINHLHAEAHAHAETAVKKAIRCGELLAAKKESMLHGAWLPWVEKHLTFGRHQAARYMRVYEHRAEVNGTSTLHLTEAVRLLSEPKEDPAGSEPVAAPASGEPGGREPGSEDVFNNDPGLERELEELKTELRRRQADAQDLGSTIRENERKIEEMLSRQQSATRELEDLRKLKADKARVEKTLRELSELERRKQELFKDSESLKVATDVLVRSREFFTRECMQIPALVFRPGTAGALRLDMMGLIELVEDWTAAMRAKFVEGS